MCDENDAENITVYLKRRLCPSVRQHFNMKTGLLTSYGGIAEEASNFWKQLKENIVKGKFELRKWERGH